MSELTKANLISYLNGRVESLNQTISNLNTLFTDDEIRIIEKLRMQAKRSEVYYIISEIEEGLFEEGLFDES